jgi:serine phosphatase RsbU (regulator of sigma subunit)
MAGTRHVTKRMMAAIGPLAMPDSSLHAPLLPGSGFFAVPERIPAPSPRARVALVGRPNGLRGPRLIARECDVVVLPEDDAQALATADVHVVLVDGAWPAKRIEAALQGLVGRDEASRPVVLLVLTSTRPPKLSESVQGIVDDVVAGTLGERQVLARIQAALRVRGWMTELSRKNAELETLYHRLEVLAGRMAEELRLASNVQRSLMPPPLQHARLEFAREFIPCREIGGDFYDFVPIGPHTLAFAIGDVMGKGVPAALLAANLKALIRAQIEQGDVCPVALVAKVNRLFWDVVPTGLFASLFFAVFDLEKGVADYVNAGHHYPFLVPAEGDVRDLVQGGTVLGLAEDSVYEQARMPVAPGDLFVFYSDGITDRMDPTGELFGIERLKEAALRARGDAARISLYSLLGEVQGWAQGAAAEDDMTLVVARAR